MPARSKKKTTRPKKKPAAKKTSSSTRSPRARRSRKKPPAGQADRGGRPSIRWTPQVAEIVGELAGFGNTVDDMARILKVSKASLEAAIGDDGLPVRQAYYLGKAELNGRLRRAQVRSALGSKDDGSGGDGNVTAQIWLGKQILGQRDTKSVELVGGDEPVRVEGDLGPLVQRKIEEFLRSRGRG